MELPKRARTADWENGVLTLDGEKKFDIPELTTEIMEQLAGYTLVGFHVKSYPVTDELLAPFAGHKSIADFAFDGSGRKVNDNIVPDLIINDLFGSSVKGLVLLFVQFPDNR